MTLSRPSYSGAPLLVHMPTKQSGWSKLSQLVPHHVLGDVNGHMAPTIVHSNGVPHHLGKDRRSSRPGLDHSLLTDSVHVFNSLQQLGSHIRPLLQRSGHDDLPIFTERLRDLAPVTDYLRFFFLRLRTIHLSVALLRRVFLPRVGLPQGLLGDGIPMGALPSPPP
jgi:hypothetical protein